MVAPTILNTAHASFLCKKQKKKVHVNEILAMNFWTHTTYSVDRLDPKVNYKKK